MKKKYYNETQGCQMNEYDSDKMKDLLSQNLGFQSTKNKEMLSLERQVSK